MGPDRLAEQGMRVRTNFLWSVIRPTKEDASMAVHMGVFFGIPFVSGMMVVGENPVLGCYLIVGYAVGAGIINEVSNNWDTIQKDILSTRNAITRRLSRS